MYSYLMSDPKPDGKLLMMIVWTELSNGQSRAARYLTHPTVECSRPLKNNRVLFEPVVQSLFHPNRILLPLLEQCL